MLVSHPGSRDNSLERLPLGHHFYTYNYVSAFGRLFIHVLFRGSAWRVSMDLQLWGHRAGIWTRRCPAAVRRANYSAMPQPLFRPCLTLNLAVSYPVFLPQLRFLKKKSCVGPFEHFFGTSQLNAPNVAQKRTKTFFKMCLRFKFGIHIRLRILIFAQKKLNHSH